MHYTPSESGGVVDPCSIPGDLYDSISSRYACDFIRLQNGLGYACLRVGFGDAVYMHAQENQIDERIRSSPVFLGGPARLSLGVREAII